MRSILLPAMGLAALAGFLQTACGPAFTVGLGDGSDGGPETSTIDQQEIGLVKPDGGVDAEIDVEVEVETSTDTASDARLDVRLSVSDAGDASHLTDATPQNGPEPEPEASIHEEVEASTPPPGSCPAPYTTAQPYCPTGCQCAGQNAPENVALVFLSTCSSGVTAMSTPAACQACGAYTCACVMANLPSSHVCGSGSGSPSCNGSTGAPTLVCP